MYGYDQHQFCGRIVRDVEVRTTEEGRSYCYFDIAVQPRGYTDASGEVVRPKAKFFHLSANGTVAKALGERGKKGSIFICSADMVEKERTVEKDGKTIVYRDHEFKVKGLAPWDIIPAGTSAEKASAPTQNAQNAATAAPQATNPEEDYEGALPDEAEFSEEESKVLGELPF